MGKAIRQSAEEIVALQKQLVKEVSGDLKDSIGYSMGSYKAENANVRGVQSGGPGDPELTAIIHAGTAKAFYAAFVEFGVSSAIAGGRFKGAQIPARPAQPFFYPAYRALKKRAKSRITRATTKAAKKVAAQ